MLDFDDRHALTARIDALPCEINLPEGWFDGAGAFGATSSNYDDQRRHPRFGCKGSGGRAALEYQASLPAIARGPRIYRVLMMDLSRSGLRFLHGEQLFPLERMRVVLPDGKRRLIEVKWCRRVQDRCYEVGCTFTEPLSG